MATEEQPGELIDLETITPAEIQAIMDDIDASNVGLDFAHGQMDFGPPE